jgi:NAD+ kinase
VVKALKGKVELGPDDPDFIITVGGDGTILDAERRFPGIPKVALRMSKSCKNCIGYKPSEAGKIISRIKQKKYKIIKYGKVEIEARGKTLTGLNEVQIHNKNPFRALRFTLKTVGKKSETIIGDGLIASTTYGSTGYYQAIGYKPFSSGIRIGFNNTYPKRRAIPLKEKAEVVILREDGLVIADNEKRMIPIVAGDKVVIRKSDEIARFLKI